MKRIGFALAMFLGLGCGPDGMATWEAWEEDSSVAATSQPLAASKVYFLGVSSSPSADRAIFQLSSAELLSLVGVIDLNTCGTGHNNLAVSADGTFYVTEGIRLRQLKCDAATQKCTCPHRPTLALTSNNLGIFTTLETISGTLQLVQRFVSIRIGSWADPLSSEYFGFRRRLPNSPWEQVPLNSVGFSLSGDIEQIQTGTLVASRVDGRILRLNSSNLAVLGVLPVESIELAYSVAAMRNRVYVGTGNGNIFRLEPAPTPVDPQAWTKTLVWKNPQEGSQWTWLDGASFQTSQN